MNWLLLTVWNKHFSTPTANANNLIDINTLTSTGTLGSISGSTVTAWQATVVTSGAFVTQGLERYDHSYLSCQRFCNSDNPTHYITTKTIFQKFEQTRLPLERIANGTTSANAGFVNLSFKGKPVIYGNYIAAGYMYGLNMNYIKLAVDTMTDMVTTDFLTPVNQTVSVAYILWRGQLWTDNRRRQLQLTSVLHKERS